MPFSSTRLCPEKAGSVRSVVSLSKPLPVPSNSSVGLESRREFMILTKMPMMNWLRMIFLHPFMQRDTSVTLLAKPILILARFRGSKWRSLAWGRAFFKGIFSKTIPKRLLALDIAEDYVRIARQFHERSGNETTSFLTSVGNVEFMPYRESFDVVVATDILEHVLNLGNALSRISRMLKPNVRVWCRLPQ